MIDNTVKKIVLTLRAVLINNSEVISFANFDF